MRFLARILQFILWTVLVVWLGRLLFGWLRRKSAGPRQAAMPPRPGPRPLRRDPVCGTYVSEEISLSLEQAGQVHHFCSAECRDRFLLSERRAAGE